MTVPEIARSAVNPYNEFLHDDGAWGKLSFVPSDYEKAIKHEFATQEQWEYFCMLPLSQESKKKIIESKKKQ
jgi:hypothetical protein